MPLSTGAVAGICVGAAVVAVIIVVVVVVVTSTLHYGGKGRLYLNLGNGTKGYLTTAGGTASIDMTGEGTVFQFLVSPFGKKGGAVVESGQGEFLMFDGSNYVSLVSQSNICSIVMTPDKSKASRMFFQHVGFTHDVKKTIQFGHGYVLSPNGTVCDAGSALYMDPSTQQLGFTTNKATPAGNQNWILSHA